MRRVLCLAVFILAGSVAAAAQSAAEQFTVTGTVLDSSRAPVAGARVSLAAARTRIAANGLTDERGQFALRVEPGRYVLRIESAGFVETSKAVEVSSHAAAGEFVLQVAGIRETLTVEAPIGYQVPAITSATKTTTPLRDVPQSVTVVTRELVRDQLMASVADVMRYVPGITTHQGENNRDQVIIRGNSSSADFFVNGVRDDVQYYRDLYNVERVEALKGPNAMIFGRGGGGGVVNRVTKEAVFEPVREFTLQAGARDQKRFTADLDHAFGAVAFRVNGMFEDGGSFRRGVGLERAALNPTLTFAPTSRTRVTLGYEHLRDNRIADRGITSVAGRPAAVDRGTFYGNPSDSEVRARVNLGSANVEHRAGKVTLRSRTLVGAYERFYQNYVPGSASADQTLVTLTAYNNATDRTNVFSQLDASSVVSTGRVRHTLLVGAEIGRQLTDNFRQSGFFNNAATSIQAPFANPTIATPVTYRQNATDADNHLRTNVAAVFAQDQVELSRYLQLLGGIRFDRFDLRYHNNRTGDTLDRVDLLYSPRGAVVVKPTASMSVYGSYSVSFLPSSGDQFSSLTVITQQVEPERFDNYEVGFKWDPHPGLSVTSAVYRLNRTNTRSTDPNDPTRIVQTGSQRTDGYELGVSGQVRPGWRIAGGYAFQDASVIRATVSARAGAVVGQVPRHTFSLWNHYQVHPRLAAGLGIVHRSDMFAAIDNTVRLPGYTRADAAAFVSLTTTLRLQANVENLFDAHYFAHADGNTNLSPGVPRTLRVALSVGF